MEALYFWAVVLLILVIKNAQLENLFKLFFALLSCIIVIWFLGYAIITTVIALHQLVQSFL